MNHPAAKIRVVIFFVIVTYLSSAQTTLYVGSAETYTTIAAAYAACTSAGTNYIIEVKNTYANAEAKPITFAANTAASIIIRPHSTIVSVLTISTGSATSVFSFTAGDNITIDGRVGSTGSTSLFTIENTQANASKYAIQFSGGSNGNTIKYCTVKGSNTSSTASSTAPGVIMFSSGTNSNNTIDNCTVRESGSNLPLVGIFSYNATNNNLLTISNNNFINFEYRPIWADGNNNTGWTISGNSFYQTATQTGGSGDILFIYLEEGTGYTISGNYFGGQAAQCGGSAFTFTGNDILNCIFFNHSTSGTITISNNTIQNIAYTTTKGAGNHWCPFDTWGSSNYVISGNTIGSTSGTGNITITDNGTSASAAEYLLGQFSGTGTNTYSNNTVGSITFNGTNSAAKDYYIAYSDQGTNTFSSNTFGNTTADNIRYTNSGAGFYGLINTGSGTFTVQNNTFQNFYQTASGNFNCINSQGSTLSCTGNTIGGVNCTGNSSNFLIYHYYNSASATISSNTISDINFSGTSSQSILIYVYSFSSSITMNSNIIGSYGVSNDITLAGNNYQAAIYIAGGTTLGMSSNIIQNIYLSNSNSSNTFDAISVINGLSGAATISNNGVDNISSEVISNTGTNRICGLSFNGTATSTFTKNSFSNFTLLSNSASCGGFIVGINLFTNTGTCTLSKNKIYNFVHNGTLGTVSAELIGIYLLNSGTAKNLYNNIILLSNGSNTNAMNILGIHSYNTGTLTAYHNTAKVSGSTSSSTVHTYPFYINTTSGTNTVKNNIFQNLRTGGTGKHYAIFNASAGNTFTEDYNYLESSTAANVGHWQGTDKTFAAWNTSSGATNNSNATITIAADGSVPAGTTSDVKTNGTNLSATVSDDYDGNSRPAAPWRGAYETTTPLPVELISFYESCFDNIVSLHWETASELNNDYFSIEKTIDGVNWKKIGLIPGAGNSNHHLLYSYTDTLTASSAEFTTSYYRLVQTDFDGQQHFSPALKSTCTTEKENLCMFPNPSTNTLHVDAQGYETIYILNSLNEIVKHIPIDPSARHHVIAVEELSQGIYFLKLSGRNKKEVCFKWQKI